MRIKIVLFITIITMLLILPIAYGYSDPVSITLIWQFLASALVGVAIFFKRIKFWFQNKISKNKSAREVKNK